MKLQSYRKAFSLLVAIVIIVIMSSVAMLVTTLSGKMVRSTTSQYQKEQAALLAKSYTELAIMAVSANDRINHSCLTDIDANNVLGSSSNNGKGYRVRTRISYIGNNLGNCTGVRVFSNSVATEASQLHIIVDVYVEYKEPDNPNAQWITYHRRTLQKI